MAYNKTTLYNKAKEIIKTKKPIFIEELISFMGIDKTTFYRHFPIDSNEYNEIRNLITDVKIEIKGGLRKKWYDSNNATTQIVLYRLLATKEENEAISLNKSDINISNGEIIRIELPQGKRIED